MDQLSKDAMEARKAGLTYGKYMATKYKPEEKPKPKPKKKKEAGPKCAICGMLIPPNTHRRRYCSAVCADRAQELREMERDKVKKEA